MDEVGSKVFTKEIKTSKKSTDLTISSQLEQNLIKEAIQEAETKYKGQVVKQVSDIMERLSMMRAIANKTERRIELCEKQLEAINKGEFQIVGIGFVGVKFNDKKLNIDWSETERW